LWNDYILPAPQNLKDKTWYTSFQESYFKKNWRNPMLSLTTFKSTVPIVVIDTSKQNIQKYTV